MDKGASLRDRAGGLRPEPAAQSQPSALIPSAGGGRRVLVCGGRDFDNWALVSKALRQLDERHGIGCIIQGGARGADFLAKKWARHNRRPSIEVAAHWDTMGKRAGMVRNQWMLDWCSPDYVVAFPGGPGTRGMIALAAGKSIPVWQPGNAQAMSAGTAKTEGLGGDSPASAVRQDAPEKDHNHDQR